MADLTISEAQAQEIIAHAIEESPNECCGILTGRDHRASRVSRARNLDASPVKYTVDPTDVQRVFREADQAGLEVLAFYHSHTATEAYPSVTDVNLMAPPDVFDYLYLIVSLADRDKPVIRAFRNVGGGNVEEAGLTIGE